MSLVKPTLDEVIYELEDGGFEARCPITDITQTLKDWRCAFTVSDLQLETVLISLGYHLKACHMVVSDIP